MDLVANVKLESFMLERTFQLNDLPCINENLEKTFQLHNLSNCPFLLPTCIPTWSTLSAVHFKSKITSKSIDETDDYISMDGPRRPAPQDCGIIGCESKLVHLKLRVNNFYKYLLNIGETSQIKLEFVTLSSISRYLNASGMIEQSFDGLYLC